MTDTKRPPSDAEVVSSLRHHARGHYESGVCELAAVRIEALAARVRELEGQTCDTCNGQQSINTPKPWCIPLTTITRGKYPVCCSDVGNSCNSWEKRRQ